MACTDAREPHEGSTSPVIWLPDPGAAQDDAECFLMESPKEGSCVTPEDWHGHSSPKMAPIESCLSGLAVRGGPFPSGSDSR